MNYVSPVLIILANVILSWNSEQEGVLARTVPFGFGVAMALLFETCRRNQLMATGAVLLLTDFAYIFNAGQALTVGTLAAKQIYAPPEAVAQGLGIVAIFLAEIVFVAWVLDRLLPERIRQPAYREDPRTRRLNTGALLLLVLGTFIAAFVAGTWSAYGIQIDLERMEAAQSADFRWQMLYEPSLMAGIAVTVDDLIRALEDGKSLRSRKGTLAIVALLAFLLFIKQVRRFMALSLVLSALQALASPYIRGRVLSQPRRLLAGALLAITLPVMLNFASLAWRRSARVFHTTNIMERVADASARLDEIDQEDLAHTSQRFTYLSVDAASVQYRPVITGSLDLGDLFVRAFAYAVPKVFFRAKAEYMPATCETAFLVMLPSLTDMACSTTSEGYIAAGLPGVFLVSVPFAVLTVLASILLRRRSVLALIWAVQIEAALGMIEGGAFGPMIFAVRGSILVLSAALAIIAALRLFLGYGFGGNRRPVHRRQPLAARHA